MEPEELPEDVVQFLIDHIDTVPQLEAVILMRDTAPQAWTADDVARRVYVSADEAMRVLQHLERAKLIVALPEGEGRVFAADGPHAATLATLIAVYRRHVVRVAQVIHAKASPGVLAFARAFQIKKEK